jgi:hypothetical protein
LSLLASEARAILIGHRPPRAGDFEADSALIFAFTHDFIMARETPERLARAFGISSVVLLPRSGHADIYRLPTLGEIMRPEIARFLR